MQSSRSAELMDCKDLPGSTPRGHSSATDRRLCSKFWIHTCGSRREWDQMATWTYKRATVTTEKTSALACKPELLFRKNGPVVFTKKYVKHTLLSKKTYGQGTEGMITGVHTGF